MCNNISTVFTIAKDMISDTIDHQKQYTFFTYISDLPDFSHDFNASDLLLDAIFATAQIRRFLLLSKSIVR